MIAASPFDQYLERIAGGEDLEPAVIEALAASADILPAGMLADALKRRLHGAAVTFLRVAACPFDRSFADAVPPAAGEVRITGAPETLDIAAAAVGSARAVAGERTVTGFSWADVERFAGETAAGSRRCWPGSRTPASTPSRRCRSICWRIGPRRSSSCARPGSSACACTSTSRLPATARRSGWRSGRCSAVSAVIESINPLPMSLSAFKPTTGYDDVKAVAIARLAAPQVPHIQVDWPRYGPKLAQVALTFGADDVDGVSASDAAPEGRRRAPLEEIRRNIEAAGFEPVERGGPQPPARRAGNQILPARRSLMPFRGGASSASARSGISTPVR